MELKQPGTGAAHTDVEKEKDREIAAAATTMLLAAFTISLLVPVVAYAFHFAY